VKVATEHRVRNSPGTNNLIAEMLRFLGSAVRLHSTWRRQICNLFRTSGVWGGGGKSKDRANVDETVLQHSSRPLARGRNGNGVVVHGARRASRANHRFAGRLEWPARRLHPCKCCRCLLLLASPLLASPLLLAASLLAPPLLSPLALLPTLLASTLLVPSSLSLLAPPLLVPPTLLAPPLLLPAPLLVLSRRAGHPVFGRGETIVASPCFA
jgi:hypothetical protein